jgi:hypothetical protein
VIWLFLFLPGLSLVLKMLAEKLLVRYVHRLHDSLRARFAAKRIKT